MQKKYKQRNSLNNFNTNNLIHKLHNLRNVFDEQEINLQNQIEHYSNLLNIDITIEFLIESILLNKKFIIVADYDVDGATSCAIAYRGLKNLGVDINFFVPNRFVHGYGLSPSVVKDVYEQFNPNIIITVDNGISSDEGVDYAKSLNIEVVITDHHLEGKNKPNTPYIINPNQKLCQFKNKSIAGCGVIYYVILALTEKLISNHNYNKSIMKDNISLVDLVALGTISDVVKLTQDNRKLVKHGLSLIRKSQTKPGIIALINISNKIPFNLSTMDIGFSIGPKINAAGRLEDMTIGINCLITDDFAAATSYAEKLHQINIERKTIESNMKNIAFDVNNINSDNIGLISYDSSFHEGVIGIVASRIKEHFYKPCIVFADTENKEHLKGSGRSIPEIHLKDVLDFISKKDSDIIIKYGGHSAAAGLTIFKNKITQFQQLFNEAIIFYKQDKVFENIKLLDLELTSNDITIENAKSINREIWGQGFEYPLFYGTFLINQQRILNENHLKLKLLQNGFEYDAIWFFHNQEIPTDNITIVFNLTVNEFRGNESIQLLIDGVLEADDGFEPPTFRL